MAIRRASDLVTSRTAIQKGFLLQALRKTEEANPHVARAHALRKRLRGVADVAEMLRCSEFFPELMAAAAFSEKAQAHFSPSQLTAAVSRVLTNIMVENGKQWKSEILYRYLLTRGDSLGGAMRNVTGALANQRFVEAVVKALRQRGAEGQFDTSRSNRGKVQRITWKDRRLVFDRTSGIIGKNIDVILLRTSVPDATDKALLSAEDSYVACGELKGGIDPAGADEHWKTGRSALERIRRAFSGPMPQLFFVAAAIAPSMAEEIFEELRCGTLDMAANLNKPSQLAAVASWLVNL